MTSPTDGENEPKSCYEPPPPKPGQTARLPAHSTVPPSRFLGPVDSPEPFPSLGDRHLPINETNSYSRSPGQLT